MRAARGGGGRGGGRGGGGGGRRRAAVAQMPSTGSGASQLAARMTPIFALASAAAGALALVLRGEKRVTG